MPTACKKLAHESEDIGQPVSSAYIEDIGSMYIRSAIGESEAVYILQCEWSDVTLFGSHMTVMSVGLSMGYERLIGGCRKLS